MFHTSRIFLATMLVLGIAGFLYLRGLPAPRSLDGLFGPSAESSNGTSEPEGAGSQLPRPVARLLWNLGEMFRGLGIALGEALERAGAELQTLMAAAPSETTPPVSAEGPIASQASPDPGEAPAGARARRALRSAGDALIATLDRAACPLRPSNGEGGSAESPPSEGCLALLGEEARRVGTDVAARVAKVFRRVLGPGDAGTQGDAV